MSPRVAGAPPSPEPLQHRGVPDYIRSDNVPEFTAIAVRQRQQQVGAKTLYIEPGSPWENGSIESFNGKLREELLNGAIFYTLKEVRVVIEDWRRHCNRERPHSALDNMAPSEFATKLAGLSPPAWQRGA
jgi:transposase InsO family protein